MIERNFDPTLPYRYIRYGRMSSDMQNARSPDQQFDTVGNAVHRASHPWVPVADYRDDGKSGRLMKNRPGFCRMLNDIKTGRVQADLILVDTLERFGRMEEVDALRRELRNKYGVLILTADSNFADPTSIAGQALGVVETIRAYGLPTSLQTAVPTEDLLGYVTRDKKTARDRVRYVLLERIGQTVLRDDVPDDMVVEALQSLGGP